MKKSLITLAAFSAFAGAAQAESSVTLYGVIDMGMDYITSASNVNTVPSTVETGRALRLSSGTLQGSLWGLRGVEDLGNGLKAIFTLESGFDAFNGEYAQSGKLFNEQAFVGLTGEFGSVTVGRQYDSTNDFVAPLVASNRGAGDFAAHPGDLDNLDNSYRINNAIKFTSANYDGITFGGLYSFGGAPGSFSKNQVWSAGANFANGPLALGASVLKANNPAVSFFDYSPKQTLNEANGAIDGFGALAKTMQIITAAGTYSFGPFTAGLAYSNVRYKGDDIIDGLAIFHTTEASLSYQFSPVLSGIVSANYTNSTGTVGEPGGKYKQLNVGLNYALSKRTDVYLVAAGQNASGTDSFGLDSVAHMKGLSPSMNGRQRVARIGIRHAF